MRLNKMCPNCFMVIIIITVCSTRVDLDDTEGVELRSLGKGRIQPISRLPQLRLGKYSVKMVDKNVLSKSECGIRHKLFIVGGTEAGEGSHPWIAGIIIDGPTPAFVAGATVINEWWVVTAAHIFKGDKRDAKEYRISVGSNDRTKGQLYSVEKIIAHNKYDEKASKEYDIAVMKIKGPIKWGPTVQPICLPRQSYQNTTSKGLTVAGWGYTRFMGLRPSLMLKETVLQVFSIEKCAQMYAKYKMKIRRSQICTFENGTDACQGDSGGPLVEFISGRATLVGIVSYGRTCADEYPGIFTKVSHYINWIQNAIGSN